MNRAEARQVLVLYRPGSADDRDPEIAAALDLVRQDAELRTWFEQHCAFQTAMRAKFREVAPPLELKDRILAQQKIVRPSFQQRPLVWLAAAAVVLAVIGLAIFWTRPANPDRFANYMARMVRTALREYRMDLVTNDMRQVRQFMATNGAPADYSVPKGLAELQLTGGGLLRWRSNPVAMVCFNRGDNQMLYLFVMQRAALKDPPPPTPQLSKVSKLVTLSWSQADKIYILAGPEESEFARKYL